MDSSREYGLKNHGYLKSYMFLKGKGSYMLFFTFESSQSLCRSVTRLLVLFPLPLLSNLKKTAVTILPSPKIKRTLQILKKNNYISVFLISRKKVSFLITETKLIKIVIL